ncbi:MAG: hypothetical protein H7A45_04520 [Verrucomicrobiales bacterium]|nr:hypothetical protein [Verrucomicrobiales bacterium]
MKRRMLPGSRSARFLLRVNGALGASLVVIALAQVPGIDRILTVGESLVDTPGLRLDALPNRVRLGPAGHVVGVATLAGDGVTTENDQGLVFVPPAGPPEILLRKGDAVSDFNGVGMVVTGINEAYVDRSGRVATFANLTHPDRRTQGILRCTGAQIELIALEGQDVGGETLTEVNSLWLTASGELRFLGIARNNHPTTAFYSDRPGPDAVVLGARLPYPGLAEGTWFGGFAGPAAYNNVGHIICYADIWAPSGAIGGSSRVDGGLWLYDGARVVHVLPRDAVGPDLADEALISSTSQLWLADDGWVLFEALLKGPGVATGNERALYAAFGDSIRLVARNGSLAPGTPGSNFGYPFLDEGIIRRGRVLFENSLHLSSGARAPSLWLWDNGRLQELAEVGQPVTAADGRPVKRLRWKAIAPSGRMFVATDYGPAQGPSVTANTLWVLDGEGEPRRLLESGDAMPLPDGGVAPIRFIYPPGNVTRAQRFDDQGRLLAVLMAEGNQPQSLVRLDPDTILPPTPGTISGTVYADADNDHQFSAGDQGLGGVRVELYYDDGAGQPFGERIEAVETDGNGDYRFSDLDPGQYLVVEVNLPGYESRSPDQLRVDLTPGTPAPGHNFLDVFSPPTATLTLHRLEPDAVQNLDDAAFSGLLPVRDPERLARLPEVTRGWVTDDVTPLIVCARFRPEDLGTLREIRWRLLPAGDGSVDHLGLDVLRGPCDVYQEDAGWVSRIGPDCSLAVAVLPRVAESALRFGQESGELQFIVLVEDVVLGLPLAQRTVALRRPPVMLVHDYNSTGDWSLDFLNAVAVEGRPFAPASRSDNFVRTARYGQELMTELEGLSARYLSLASTGTLQRRNTFAPLADLVPELDAALSAELAALREAWAVTRFDVVGHGQGGVLARMLASEQGIEGSHPAFRNPENFHRGRFRSVITIGAPHNGSRLIAYLRELDRNRDFLRRLPESVVSLGLFSTAVQAKFDPFGEQIKALNNPSTQNPWKPDPRARFHRVAGAVYWKSKLFSQLGLGNDLFRHVAVNGAFSDGLVDERSALARGDLPELGRNAFQTKEIGHFESLTVITNGCEEYREQYAFACRVESPTGLGTGGLVAGLLGSMATGSEGAFGPLPVPALLTEGDRREISAAASDALAANWASSEARIVPDEAGAFGATNGRGLAGGGGNAGTVHGYRLDAGDREPDGEVSWYAEAFGPDGVTAEGLLVTPVPEDPGRVEVAVPDSAVGDVVLYVSFAAANGGTAFGRPAQVIERDPAGAPITDIAVLPPSGTYPAGEVIKPRLLVAYADGTVLQRYVTEDNLSAISSAPNVVDVSDPIVWHLAEPGRATVTVSYRGFSVSSELTVEAAPPVDASLWIVGWSLEGETVRLTVRGPRSAGLALWHTPALSPAEWTEVEDAVVEEAGPNEVTLTASRPMGASAFYHIRAVAP